MISNRKNGRYVLKGNAVFDSVSDKPFEGIVVIEGNRITAVEKGYDRIDDYIDKDTHLIDCTDRLILPGFIDAHMHFFDGIFQNSKFMCRDLFSCRSARECADTIAEFAKKNPEYKTITGMGWFIPSWEDKTPPTKDLLDEIEPDRPVYLMCADGHSFWLNSKAMEESGINPERKLLFGEIEKDEKGNPNGVLHELDACAPCAVNAQKLPPEERKKLILDFLQTMAKNGITSTTDMAILPNPFPLTDDVKAVLELEQEDRFDLRLNIYPSLGTGEDFSIADEYRNACCSDKVRVAGLKAFVDGVHGNHTALVIDPYEDKPDSKGESFYSYNYYINQVEKANRAGYGVKLHCCGEGAVMWALDAFENAKSKTENMAIRNSIEHIETLRPEQSIRFADNNVTATMQPLHLMYEGDMLYCRLGEERAGYQYAIAKLLDDGVNVAFSSDYPVAEFDPLVNIYFSVTRCDRDGNPVEKKSTQAISIAQALKACTYGGAYCVGMENKIGTLEAGKLADVIVLDKNLFEIESMDILKTKAALTMIDGKIVYDALTKEV